jgi:hypothetical protein
VSKNKNIHTKILPVNEVIHIVIKISQFKEVITMAFFKDLGKKITEGVQDASEKASELVEVNKLNSAISKEKNAINEVKRQIGEKIFAMYKGGETVPAPVSDELRIIDTHLQAVAGFEAKIAELKGEPTAYQAPAAPPAAPPAAAAPVAAPPAAAPTPPPVEPSAAVGQFCSNCGAKLVEGTSFCGDCGQKF